LQDAGVGSGGVSSEEMDPQAIMVVLCHHGVRSMRVASHRLPPLA
jgi:hypothetical protein